MERSSKVAVAARTASVGRWRVRLRLLVRIGSRMLKEGSRGKILWMFLRTSGLMEMGALARAWGAASRQVRAVILIAVVMAEGDFMLLWI